MTSYNNHDFIQREGYRIYSGWNVDFAGSGLMGMLPEAISYDIVKDLLGEPVHIDGERVLDRWHLVFNDGTVATIFNFKGDSGLFVGGFKPIALEKVKELFNA